MFTPAQIKDLLANAEATIDYFDSQLLEHNEQPYSFLMYELISDLTNLVKQLQEDEAVHKTSADYFNQAISQIFPGSKL